MGDIVAIVLGAGSSARLGRPKQLLPVGDTTLLGWTVRECTASSSLDRVVVVLGGGGAAVERSMPPGRAEIAHNDAYGEGCASSLLAGLDAAEECDAIVLLLGDMPGVGAATIDEVVARWRAAPTWAALTSYRGVLGHPFVFSAAAFETLRGLHGDKAVWKVVDREPVERVARIEIDRDLPGDVDTWDDYLAVCAELGVAAVDV